MASSFSSGAKDTAVSLSVWPLIMVNSRPPVRQTAAVVSSPAVARRWPLGEKSTSFTGPLCAWIKRSPPVDQMRTVPFLEAAASPEPFGE